MLVTLSTWLEQRFPDGEAPSKRTIMRMVRSGELKGTVLGKTCYIDDEAFQERVNSKPVSKPKPVDRPEFWDKV